MDGTVITVTNQKGGVGKTTTATNLAVGLARAGKVTMLIDMDPQCNATTGLGIARASGPRPLRDIFTASPRQGKTAPMLHEIAVNAGIENLILVPGDPHIADLDILPPALGNAIAPYMPPQDDQLDVCIIDTPPSLGRLTTTALFAAGNCPTGWVLVPLEVGKFSLDGLAGLLDTIDAFSASFRAERATESFFRILLNKVRKSVKRNREYTDRELEPYKDQLFETEIRLNDALSQAQNWEKPIYDFNAKSAGSIDYQSLVEEVLRFSQSLGGAQNDQDERGEMTHEPTSTAAQ